MSVSMLATLSDAELLDRVRVGDEAAFTELYSRHREVALRMAAVYCRRGEADDLVDVAFEKVLGALRRGRGPTGSFRAYLFVTLRRLAAEQAERPRERSLEALPEPVAAVAAEPGLDPAEREMVTSAFDSLPDRWQAVLWHTAVEGRHPRELAGDLGMSANAVSALAYRAREKLRQAYLQAHLQVAPRPRCEPHRSALGAYVRDGQSPRERRATSVHLEGCGSCRALVLELHDVNQLLTRTVLPLFLAPSLTGVGAGALAGLGGVAEAGNDVVRRAVGWARVHHVGSLVGGVAATAALLVGVLEIGPHLGEPEAMQTGAAGTTVGTDAPVPEVAAPLVDAPPPPAQLASCAVPGVGQVPAAPNAGGTTDTTGPPTTESEGLLSILDPVLDAVTTTTAPVLPPVSTAGLAQLSCTPTTPGRGDLSLVVGAPEEPLAQVDAGDGAVDVEVGGPLPVEATVTIDLSDGARVALGVGLPTGCELSEDRRALTCALSSIPGLPTEILGLEVEALQSGAQSATVTVRAADQTLLSQTVDLSTLTGGLTEGVTDTVTDTVTEGLGALTDGLTGG